MPASAQRNPSRVAIAARWLITAGGLAVVAAVVLASAEADLMEARAARDVALADERTHAEHLRRHEVFLEAVEARDPTLMRTLVQTQFHAAAGLTPSSGTRPGPDSGSDPDAHRDATFWAHLTPAAHEPPPAAAPPSLLRRIATHDRYRLWLIAAGSLAILCGLLPLERPYRSA